MFCGSIFSLLKIQKLIYNEKLSGSTIAALHNPFLQLDHMPFFQVSKLGDPVLVFVLVVPTYDCSFAIHQMQ